MSRTLTVVTPENVELTFELAGLGTRFLAAMVDYTAVALIIAALLALFFLAQDVLFKLTGTWVIAVCVMVGFATDWCYFIGFESRWRGQTPGKRRLKLRVLKAGGFPIDTRAALLRNFLRAVDFLPSLYSVGVIAIFCSEHHQRLGDMAAGTVVVRERDEVEAASDIMWRRAPGRFAPAVLERLTGEPLSLLRGYVTRYNTLGNEVRDTLAASIAAALAPGLECTLEALTPADTSLLDLWSDWQTWQQAPAEVGAPRGLGAPGEWSTP